MIMEKLKKLGWQVILGTCIGLTNVYAIAFEPFIVKAVQVKGLHHVKELTLMNYLPLKLGSSLDSLKSKKILDELYATDFFQDVSLSKNQSTLVITVKERPIITSLSITGSRDIEKKALHESLQKLGLAEGYRFKETILEKVKEDLKAQYQHRGKYKIKIHADVKQLGNQRVALSLVISEGKSTKISQIKFLGNRHFNQATLLKQLPLTTSSPLTWLTEKDVYVKDKVDAALEALKYYYLDKGYLKMQIDGVQTSLSPDKKEVVLTLSLTEGDIYTYKGYGIEGQLNVIPKSVLEAWVSIKPGQVFSRKQIAAIVEKMGYEFSNLGYSMPQINAEPDIDEANKQVFIRFMILPGKAMYVRRIHFSGNQKTADYVLRHAFRQPEGSLMSLAKIKESERRLRMSGFFKEVSVKTELLPEVDNQVDLNVNVVEQGTSKFSVTGGYYLGGGLEFGTSIEQPNFLGTGRTAGVGFTHNDFGQSYTLNYYDPYASLNDVGQGIELYYQRARESKSIDVTDYRANRLGGILTYQIPFTDNSGFQLGIGYDLYSLTNRSANSQQLAREVIAFIQQHGSRYHHIRLTGGWSYNNLDLLIFPTKGVASQTSLLLNIPAIKKSFSYYKINHKTKWFKPLPYQFIFSLGTQLGYGASFRQVNGFPFYENYYAGGAVTQGEVRGFENFSLGPRDSYGNYFGGNALVSATAELILPKPISGDSFRTLLFLDAGNVYSVGLPSSLKPTFSKSGPMRSSVGASLAWNPAFLGTAALEFSLAYPIQKWKNDKLQSFHFKLSSGY